MGCLLEEIWGLNGAFKGKVPGRLKDPGVLGWRVYPSLAWVQSTPRTRTSVYPFSCSRFIVLHKVCGRVGIVASIPRIHELERAHRNPAFANPLVARASVFSLWHLQRETCQKSRNWNSIPVLCQSYTDICWDFWRTKLRIWSDNLKFCVIFVMLVHNKWILMRQRYLLKFSNFYRNNN